MRYNTCGDWRVLDEILVITVARLSNPLYHFAVAFHEYAEAVACIAKGITDKDVDDFDIYGPGALLDDPGRDPRAPYHKQHIVAEALEANFAKHIGIIWERYSQEIEETQYGNETSNA